MTEQRFFDHYTGKAVTTCILTKNLKGNDVAYLFTGMGTLSQ